MKNKKRNCFCILLAAIMMLQFTACAESENSAEDAAENTAQQTQTTDEVVVEEEEEVELQPDIPELDFGGNTFTWLTSGSVDDNGVDWVTYDVWVEELTGDVINDAVFDRNIWLEDKYNVKMAENKTNSTTYGDIQIAAKAGSAGFNAAFTGFARVASLCQSGYLYNMYDLPYIDLSKPWWDQRAIEDLTIYGDVYGATGDITVIDNDATWVLMFNKQMILDYNLDDPYTLVREDTWSYDKFYEMISVPAADLNGDGKLTPQNDQYGFITTGDSCQGLFYASGEKISKRDDDGIPALVENIDRLTAVVEKAGMIMRSEDYIYVNDWTSYGTDNIRFAFQEGRGLFYGEVMQCITRMRESDTDFGLVPWPKFDESQSGYYNFVHSTAGKMVCIPVCEQNTEMAGAIVEATAAKSKYTLTVAYYDVALTYKYMRDQESTEMLDIILESRCFDPAYIYDWGGLYSTVRGIIYNGGEGLSSKWNSMTKVYNKSANKTLDKLADIHESRG